MSIFQSFLQLENDLREIEISFFIASFYSEVIDLSGNYYRNNIQATISAF